MNFIKTFLFVFCVLMSVFADDTLNIAIAPENDVQVTFYPVKYDATALFNSAGWAIGFINTKGDKKFDYNGSHMQVDLRSIPETVEIISAKLCLYVSNVVMDYNHDNKIATLSHYFSTGFTGDCLSDVQYAVDPPPVIEHVFDFNSGTQIGWAKINVKNHIIKDIESNCNWTCFSLGYAPHEDELERLGEAKGIVTASANNSSNQPYLQIITREKNSSCVLSQNKVHDINKLTVANGSLKYELPSDSRVLLTIHNLQGKMIKTYINNVQKAGLHQVDIGNTYLAKGQYILSFKTGTFNTKKIISIYK